MTSLARFAIARELFTFCGLLHETTLTADSNFAGVMSAGLIWYSEDECPAE